MKRGVGFGGKNGEHALRKGSKLCETSLRTELRLAHDMFRASSCIWQSPATTARRGAIPDTRILSGAGDPSRQAVPTCNTHR